MHYRHIPIAIALLVATGAVTLAMTRPTIPPTVPALTSPPLNASTETGLQDDAFTLHSAESTAPSPEVSSYVPNDDRCPSFAPRATAHTKGWHPFSNRNLCLTLDVPPGWLTDVSDASDAITIMEPTGHEGEYHETQYVGELAGMVVLHFVRAEAWGPEPRRYARLSTAVYAAQDPYPVTGVVSFRVLLTDRTIIDVSAYAPQGDVARRDVVRQIVRNIAVATGGTPIRLAPYVD